MLLVISPSPPASFTAIPGGRGLVSDPADLRHAGITDYGVLGAAFARPEYRSYCDAFAVFSRIIAIRPCTLPPLRWMMEANSERWVTDMLIPSTMTSLTL